MSRNPRANVPKGGCQESKALVERLEPRHMLASATFVYDPPTGSANPHTARFDIDQAQVPAQAILSLTNLTTGTSINPVTFASGTWSGGASAIYTFPSYSNGAAGALPDGNYFGVLADRAQAPAQQVILSTEFFYLTGDVTHDRFVNGADFNVLAANFGGTGKRFSQGDANYDTLVNGADFNIIASRFGTSLPAPTNPFKLTGTVTSSDTVELWWAVVSGAATYRTDISVDGTIFHELIDNQSTDPKITLAGFETADPVQAYVARVAALDSAGAVLATSNNVTVLAPAASRHADSAAAGVNLRGSSLSQPPTKLLLAINGAYPLGGDVLDVYGNKWFEMMVADTGLSVSHTENAAYDERFPKRGLLDLLVQVDTNSDHRISQAEDDAVKLIFAGYSWGAISAANMSRLVRANQIGFEGGVTYNLDVDLTVDLLLLIDPVRKGPFGLAQVLKPVFGPIEQNVTRMANFYQRRGGNTTFDLFFPGSSSNGSNFNSIFFIDHEPINAPVAGLKGDTMPHHLAAGNVNEVNISSLGQRYATNVEYFRDPLDPDRYGTNNWFDANLKASAVQHDTMPFYVRGGNGGNFGNDVNWSKEIDNV